MKTATLSWVVIVTGALAIAFAAGDEFNGALAQPSIRTPEVHFEPTPQHVVEEMVIWVVPEPAVRGAK